MNLSFLASKWSGFNKQLLGVTIPWSGGYIFCQKVTNVGSTLSPLHPTPHHRFQELKNWVSHHLASCTSLLGQRTLPSSKCSLVVGFFFNCFQGLECSSMPFQAEWDLSWAKFAIADLFWACPGQVKFFSRRLGSKRNPTQSSASQRWFLH